MNNIYSWVDTPRIKGLKGANPQAVGERLEALIEGGDGTIADLDPTTIVRAARGDPILHPHFEWHDDIAGERWRIQQARHLVNALRVERIVDDRTEKVPAFASIRADDGHRSYQPLSVIESSADLQRALLKQALTDLRGWMRRLSHFTHICDVLKPAVDALEAEMRRYDAAAEAATQSVKNKRTGGARGASSDRPRP